MKVKKCDFYASFLKRLGKIRLKPKPTAPKPASSISKFLSMPVFARIVGDFEPRTSPWVDVPPLELELELELELLELPPELLSLGDELGEGAGEEAGDGLGFGLSTGEGLGDGLPPPVLHETPSSHSSGEGEGLGFVDGDGDGLSDGEGDGLSDGLGLGDSLGDGDGLGLGDGDGDGDALGDGLGFSLGVGLGLWLGVGDGLGDASKQTGNVTPCGRLGASGEHDPNVSVGDTGVIVPGGNPIVPHAVKPTVPSGLGFPPVTSIFELASVKIF